MALLIAFIFHFRLVYVMLCIFSDRNSKIPNTLYTLCTHACTCLYINIYMNILIHPKFSNLDQWCKYIQNNSYYSHEKLIIYFMSSYRNNAIDTWATVQVSLQLRKRFAEILTGRFEFYVDTRQCGSDTCSHAHQARYVSSKRM